MKPAEILSLPEGMHGQNKGKLVAGRKYYCKNSCPAAEVTAHGLVEAEQILNSKL